jgi:DNA-binding MarR family transcriptional regulator
MNEPLKRERAVTKPSKTELQKMARAQAAPFLAASVGRLSNLYPHWLLLKIEKRHGVSSSRLIAMWLLDNHGPVTMGALARAIDLTPRAVTRIADGLEADGYVIRMTDASDRRIINVALTSNGRRFLKNVFPDVAANFVSLFEILDPKEAIELVRILEKLTDHMKKQIDEE